MKHLPSIILVLTLVHQVAPANAFRKQTDGVTSQKLQETSNIELCLTEGCIQAAAEILSNMDQSKDPCEDFYSFVCGRYPERRIIEDDQTGISVFSEIWTTVSQNIRRLLEEPILDDEPNFSILAKNFYKSCMNKEKIEEVGLEPLRNLISKLGGWPVLEGDNWDEAQFDWQDFVRKTKLLGAVSKKLLAIYLMQDMKNCSRLLIQISQPILSFSKANNPYIPSYIVYYVRLAKLLGADPERARKEVMEIIQFELQLTNITVPVEELRNLSIQYNLMTIQVLEENFSSISWLSLINSLLPENDAVDLDEIVNVPHPSYLKRLSNLLHKTSKRVLANTLMAKFLDTYMHLTTKQASLILKDYLSNTTRIVSEKPRWKVCVSQTTAYFDAAVGALYVRKYFKEDAKDEALEMFQRIREEFMKILKEIDWMDEATRIQAEEKVKTITTHIGYPSELLDDSVLNDYYEDVEIDLDKYFYNTMNLNIGIMDKAYSNLREEVNKSDWRYHSKVTTVNAFQNPSHNSIEIPAGILQGQFFSKDRPRYINYGSMGTIIGHELTHGFDNVGSQFDKEGSLKSWWKEDTKHIYLEKTQCIMWQYGNYTVKELNISVNGIRTQRENVADNGGIRESYRAYQQWVAENGPEKLLPGLPYNQNQMFWISSAASWCKIQRPKTLRKQVLYDTHAPKNFRVTGMVSNMPKFAEDFSCSLGSPMNPEHKCRVW